MTEEPNELTEADYAELIVMHERVDNDLLAKLWPVIAEHNHANPGTVTVATNAITTTYLTAAMIADEQSPAHVDEDDMVKFTDMLGEYLYFMAMQMFMVHQAEAKAHALADLKAGTTQKDQTDGNH